MNPERGDSRERARRWLIGKDCRYKSDTFLPQDVDELTELLDEAEARALEKAAQVADEYCLRNPKWNSYHQDAWMEIAKAIRALKEQQ